jgi:hypothetical protein
LGVVILAVGVFYTSVRSAYSERQALQRVWAGGVVATAMILHTAYVAVALDPVYRRMGDLAHHTIWHPFYYALQSHPNWTSKYGPSHDYAVGDDQPRAAVKHYLARQPLPPTQGTSPYRDDHGNLKFTEYEKYVRKAFFEFVRNDPRFVFETFLINIYAMFYQLGLRLIGFGSHTSYWGWGFAATGAAILTLLVVDPAARRAFGYDAALAVGVFFVSIAPLVATVPVVSENLILLVVAIASCGLFGLAHAIALRIRPIAR